MWWAMVSLSLQLILSQNNVIQPDSVSRWTKKLPNLLLASYWKTGWIILIRLLMEPQRSSITHIRGLSRINCPNQSRSFQHDTTINTLLIGLGMKSELIGPANCDYAATVACELWEHEGVYFIKLLFSANIDAEFEPFTRYSKFEFLSLICFQKTAGLRFRSLSTFWIP